jgi:hypothetical protein
VTNLEVYKPVSLCDSKHSSQIMQIVRKSHSFIYGVRATDPDLSKCHKLSRST